MARCSVVLEHSRARKNIIVDDASSDADAIRQFRERIDLPELPEGEKEWPIIIDWLGAPAPTEGSLPGIDALPKTAKEAIANVAGTDPPATAGEPVEPEPAFSPDSVTELKNFGLDDSDGLKLTKAKLTTVSAVIAYAKTNKGLIGILDVGPAMEKKIRAAIKSHQVAQL